MKKVEKNELLSRAKNLYFDKNKNIDVVFADEYGRFSYSKAPLLEANKGTDVAVFSIKKGALNGKSLQNVNDFSKKDHVEKVFNKKK